jgi:hypothetical protein
MAATVPSGFVPRGEELEALRAHIRETHREERRRRIGELVKIVGGWVVAGFMTVVAAGCLVAMIRRPAPQDRVYVAFVYGEHAEGIPREDLPANRREIVLRNTLRAYLRARVEYVWQTQNQAYALVSALSTPEVRQAYQDAVWDDKAPGHPHQVYGNSPQAGSAVVTQATIRRDPRAPYSATAVFILHRELPNRPAQDVRMNAVLAWGDAGPGDIPIDVQEQHDPLNIQITAFEAYPDPGAL